MKVTELIEILKQYDEDTYVEVLVKEGEKSYFRKITPEDIDYTDFSNNKFAKGKPWENEKVLQLGSI